MKRNRSKPPGMLARLVFAVIVGGVAYLAARPYGDAAPLGVAVPEVPQAVETEGIEVDDSSIVVRRMAEVMLEFAAPQADGLPPLLRQWDAAQGSFSIRHPHRIELSEFGRSDFSETNVMAVAWLDFDQPLTSITYRFDTAKEGETAAVYVSRLRDRMERDGIRFLGKQGQLEADGYLFHSLEYLAVDDNGTQLAHFAYFGPFGTKVLIIDFAGPVEHAASGREYARKIAATFEPGRQLRQLLTDETDNVATDDQPAEDSGGQ